MAQEDASQLTNVQITAFACAANRSLDGEICGRPLFDGTQGMTKLTAHVQTLQVPQDTTTAEENSNVAVCRGLITACKNDSGKEGGNSYFVARAYLLDLDVQKQLAVLRERFPEAPRLQVVNLGAGMCSRPWRVTMPPGVSWFDVDQPNVVQFKAQLLAKANAQTIGPLQQQQGQPAATEPTTAPAFSLLCDAYHMVGCELSASEEGGSLRAALAASGGFDSGLPTLWVLEGLVYYLDMPTLSKVVTDMTALSPPGSVALITAITKVALQMWQEKLTPRYESVPPPKGSMWFYNCLDDFVTGGGRTPDSPNLMHDLGWKVDELSPEYAEYLPKVLPGRFTYAAYPKLLDFGPNIDIANTPVELTVTVTHMLCRTP